MEAEHKIISNNPVADGVPSPTKEVTMADARLGTFANTTSTTSIYSFNGLNQ